MVHSEDEPFFEFTWTISNFSLCRHKPDEFLDSPAFVVQFLQNTEWYLKLYPKGLRDTNSLMCFLQRTHVGPGSISVKYSISIENSNCEVQQIFKRKSTSEKFVKVSINRYLSRMNVSESDDDHLKVTCRLRKCSRQSDSLLNSVAQAPHPPVCCSSVTHVPNERRSISWRIKDFLCLPSQHEICIPVVSASPKSPKLLVTLSWCDDTLKEGGGLKKKGREMPELVGKTFQLGCRIQLVDSKSKRHKMARGWYLFKTLQKNYFLWVKTYSDSVWNFPLAIDRTVLRQKRGEYLTGGELVLECDFALSYDNVVSHIVSSAYMHPKPEPKVESDSGSGATSDDSWKDVLLRNFNDQTKFFLMLFLFLAVIWSHFAVD